jgi:adenylate kinase
MKMIFLGAPGAGKGTQAENVSEKYGIPAISTGAIIRESVKNGTEAGLAAKSYIDSGALVPDKVVIDIIKERLADADCKNGFILDGFPRTLVQAEELEKLGVSIDFAITIEVPDDKIIRRMSGRRVCSDCGASYHIEYKPSLDGKTCDKCGTALTTRRDDLPEVVKSRLEVYHEQTAPVKEFYKKSGKLLEVIGQEEVKDTTALTMKAVETGILMSRGEKN